jgi:hypothetical protein
VRRSLVMLGIDWGYFGEEVATSARRMGWIIVE